MVAPHTVMYPKTKCSFQLKCLLISGGLPRAKTLFLRCSGVPPGHEEFARKLLDDGRVGIVAIEQDDAWIRDTGPLFLVSGACTGRSGNQDMQRNIRGVDWTFNAWGGELGGCFSSWEKDDAVASTVLGLAGAERYKADMILEVGGHPVQDSGSCSHHSKG